MTDRTVKVSLVAQINNYVTGMQTAARETAKTASEADKLAKKKEAFQQLGVGLMAMGAVAAAGVAIAVKKFADWDAQMSQVQTLSHATAGEMERLRDASLNMGQAIGFSATQVADAETELVKAGVSVRDILGGGLVGALNLAAAGQINVGKATEIASVALTQFGLKGKDVPHVADLLAAGADKALGGVDQLGQALNQGGLVASQFGLTIDDTVGTLSAFANAGLLGSDAGTSFKQMLLALASPSQKAADTMKQYNIQAYDARGNFVGITNLAGQLKDNFKGVSDAQRDFALSTIFGSDAIRTANVLYKEGAAGIQGWINTVNDSGFAAQQARGKMDNLNGDLKKLGAAFDTALIKSGSGANDVLRSVAQGLTTVLHVVGDIPKPVLTAGLALTALVAAIGLVGGGALIAVPKIAQFRVALETLNITGPRVAASMTAVGTALRAVPYVAVLAWLGQLSSSFVDTAREAMGLQESVGSLTSKLKNGVDKKAIDSQLNGSFAGIQTGIDRLHTLTDMGWLSQFNKQAGDLFDGFSEYSGVFKIFGAGTSDITAKVKTLDSSLADMVKKGEGKQAAETFEYLKTKTDGSKEALANLAKLFPEYSKAAKGAKKPTDDNAESVQTAAQSYLAAADNASQLKDEIVSLTNEINKANGVGQDAVSANAAYQDTLAKVADTIDKAKRGVKDYSTSIDESTAAGSANVKMFSDQAASSQAAAKAQFDVDHNTQGYIATLQAGRQKLLDNITALTGNADAAKAIADRVYQIPDQKAVRILAETAEAQRALDNFNALVADATRTRVAHILVQATNPKVGFGLGDGHADGGYITGPGGPRDDRVPAMLSNGEFVVNAAATSRHLALLRSINSGRGFANGGQVTPTYVPASSFPTSTSVTVKTSDRPIHMDGQLFGVLREMANGEAQIVLNADKARDARRTRMG